MGECSKLRISRRPRLLSKFSHLAIELSLSPSASHPFPVELGTLALLSLLGASAPESIAKNSSSHIVSDVRGRPRETFDSPPGSIIDEKRRREELFSVSGIFSAPDSSPSDTAPLEQDLFSIDLLTQFDSFRGSQHILHSCQKVLHGFPADIASRFCLSQLGYLLPVQVTNCRLGLEFYKSRFRGSMLSFAAGIEQRLYVELKAESLWLRFTDEYAPLTGLPDVLIPDGPIEFALRRLLEETLGFLGVFSTISRVCESHSKRLSEEQLIAQPQSAR